MICALPFQLSKRLRQRVEFHFLFHTCQVFVTLYYMICFRIHSMPSVCYTIILYPMIYVIKIVWCESLTFFFFKIDSLKSKILGNIISIMIYKINLNNKNLHDNIILQKETDTFEYRQCIQRQVLVVKHRSVWIISLSEPECLQSVLSYKTIWINNVDHEIKHGR